MNVEVVISINVHENVPFLMKQLNNIQTYLNCTYIVILNCNDYMKNALKVILPNVHIHPLPLNKQRETGTLTKGIYLNMIHALRIASFKYFLVLSSRNLFYQPLTINILDERQKTATSIEDLKHSVPPPYHRWHWPTFLKTKLAKHYRSTGLHLHSSCHEGLVFHYDVCQNIIRFLERHPSIRDDLFQFPWCVEEFALQTISMYEMNRQNRHYGFTTINKSVNTDETAPTDSEWYVYKTNRL
jgi:hypothetical protein